MTNFDFLRSMSIDELAEWLDEHGLFDNSPWSNWFNDKYCANCESIQCKDEKTLEEKIGIEPFYPGHEVDCAYCEIHKNCRFFKDQDTVPDVTDIIKMWLLEEANND